MNQIWMKTFFLGLTAAGVLMKSTGTRSVQQDGSRERGFTVKQETYADENTQKWASVRDIKRKLNSELKTLLVEARACRKNYPNLSDQSFGLKLYGFLIDELAGTPNKTSIFHCSINKGLVDNVRDKLYQLENFQKNFVLNPKNNSTESPGEQQRNPQKIRSHSAGGVENDLNLNLEEEWKAKVPYMSHIYLGSSIFPLLTEESRVIEIRPTTPRPTSSDRALNIFRKKASGTIARVYELLTPLRWSKDIGNHINASRLTRRIHPRSLVRPYQETDGVSKEEFQDEFFSKSEAPVKRNLLPENNNSNVGSPTAEVIHPLSIAENNPLSKAFYVAFVAHAERVNKVLNELNSKVKMYFNQLFRTKNYINKSGGTPINSPNLVNYWKAHFSDSL